MSIYVYLADMPTKIKAVTTPCDDGYTVYINSNLTREQQEAAYRHEVLHIENDDFSCFRVADIEKANERRLLNGK